MCPYSRGRTWNFLEDLLKREGDRTAAVIMEPINFTGYLEGLLPRSGE